MVFYQGSHTQLHSQLGEFWLMFGWDTTEHSKYQSVSYYTIALQTTYPPHLLVNETISTETAWTMIKLPQFCVMFWQNFELTEDLWNCLSFDWVCRNSDFGWVLQSRWNPVYYVNLRDIIWCLKCHALLQECYSCHCAGSSTSVSQRQCLPLPMPTTPERPTQHSCWCKK